MASINWTYKRLGDADLLQKLRDVRDDAQYEELNLSYNKLKSVPDLRKYRQFHNLKVLNLGSNNIRDIDFSHIPPKVTELDISGNKLTAIGNCKKFTKLTHLYAYYNQIAVVDWRNLPPTLTWLYLNNNKLSSIGDCSQCTQLSVLSVYRNEIQNVDWRNLPPALTWLHLYKNQLSTVGECNQCTQLQWFNLSDNPMLHSIQGLPDQDFDLDINSNVKVLGQKCFHQTTYHILKVKCQTLEWKLQQPPVEVLLQGLEVVKEYYSDKSIRTTHTSMMLLGPTAAGKSSMMNSLIEGKSVLVPFDDHTQVADIKTWYITAEDSIQLFDHGGHEIYRITTPLFIVLNSIIALVHDISQVSKAKIEDTTSILRHALAYHPENQVHLVLTHTDVVDVDDVHKNSSFIKEKVNTCIDQEIQSLKHVTEKDEERAYLSAQLQKQKDNMEVFLLSSRSYDGMENLKEFLKKVTTQKRVSLPTKWVRLYKLMLNQEKNFFKVTELQELCKTLFFKGTQLFQQAEIMKTFTSALEYYRAAGHVLHFPDNPVLEDYVFHNKDFLLQIAKSCFHHNLKKATDFNNFLQSIKVSHIDLMLQQYNQEGLLAIELLRFLWQQYGLKKEDEIAVLEIMKKIHICYPVDVSERVFFFPFFLKSKEPPASLDLSNHYSIKKQYFSVLLHCVFHNVVPINAFEAMQVQVQKTAVERKYGGSRYAWRDGIQVKIGTLEIRAVKKADKSTIEICVCAPVTDVEEVWKVTTDVYSDLESVLRPLLGVIKIVSFKCTHCMVKGLHPVKNRSPSEVLNTEGLDVTYDCCKGDKIPRALVIVPSAGSKKIKEHTTEVQKYLKKTLKEMSPPGKVLYLDCEEIGVNQFHLKWGWPTCDEETGSIAEMTHAVVEYRQEQQWARLSDNIKTSPYMVECNAEEFRVAAVNKNGSGEFSYVTPYRVVQAEEMISETDTDHMKENHEFFTRMSNVSDIILRLYTRGVISDLVYDRLNGVEKKADALMKKVIYRSTYKKLYLFQKTLQETGQSVMAATVPVELERKTVVSQESSVATNTVKLAELETELKGLPSDQRLLTYQRDA